MALASAFEPREARVLGLIGIAHMLSHVYVVLLPPIFPLLRGELGASYAELGLLITAYAVVTGIGQTPVGFLVDRIGGRNLLIAGCALQGVAISAIAFVEPLWAMIALYAVAGLANTVFHPADYAILSASVPRERLGRAFSLHSFSGQLGFTVTPPAMIAVTMLADWRSAVFFAGLLSVVVAGLIAWQRDYLAEEQAAAPAAGETAAFTSWRDGMALLLSLPILMAFLFYVFNAMGYGAIRTFAVAAIVDIEQATVAAANGVLTGLLIGTTVGVFAAGFIIDRLGRPGLVTGAGFVLSALLLILIGSVSMPILVLTAVMTVTGLCVGVVQPARDMLVRQVTPPGAAGKVFGFVSTGLGVGGAIMPLIFGWVLDQGDPRWLFWLAALFMLVSVLTIGRFAGAGRAEPAARPVPAAKPH